MDGDAQDLFLWPLSASLFEAGVGCSLSQQWTNQFYGVGGSARVSFKASGPYIAVGNSGRNGARTACTGGKKLQVLCYESLESPNSSLQDVR